MTIAEQLSQEDHDITIIDNNEKKLTSVTDKMDVLGVHGNGATLPILKEAGVEKTDLVIAVTATDELNMLSCLIAKKAGAKNTIARVRNPEYADVISAIKQDMGLSLSINPELACAMEIARVLKFPSMIKVDTFAKGRVELLQFVVPENSFIAGKKLKELGRDHKVLICAAEREALDEAIIPTGDFTIQAGDKLSVVGDPYQELKFFKHIGIKSDRAKSLMIVGGGKIAYYLAKFMLTVKVDVKIIERDYARCEELADLLPEAVIIHGDGTDQALLLEEGIEYMDAFAALTGYDEENIVMSLYVSKMSNAKLITKVKRNPFMNITKTLNLGSVYSPRKVAADSIVRYVRSMQNSFDSGSNVKALTHIVDDKAEALEFVVKEGSPVTDIPLMQLKIKKNHIIGIINRSGKIIIPGGSDVLTAGDTVVVITTESGLTKLEDILE